MLEELRGSPGIGKTAELIEATVITATNNSVRLELNASILVNVMVLAMRAEFR